MRTMIFGLRFAKGWLIGLHGCEAIITGWTAINQCGLIGMLQWQIAAGGPSHFVGPFPFREPMPPSTICHCNLLCVSKGEKCRLVRRIAGFKVLQCRRRLSATATCFAVRREKTKGSVRGKADFSMQPLVFVLMIGGACPKSFLQETLPLSEHCRMPIILRNSDFSNILVISS